MNLPFHQSSEINDKRHCASFLLACVISRFFPNVLLAGGGSNSFGFFYDFVFEQPLTDGLLEIIEVKLRTLIKEDLPVRCLSMMRENASSFFEHQRQPLLALCAGKENANILNVVQVDEFHCLSPFLSITTTLETGHVKLLEVETFIQVVQDKEVTVTRILGVTQNSFKDLKAFIKSYDSLLKKKDHRLLGPQLKLFSLGQFGIVWHPKGIRLRSLIQEWVLRQFPQEQHEVATSSIIPQYPQLDDPFLFDPFEFEEEMYRLRSSLTSQHLEFFREGSLKAENFPWRIHESAVLYRQFPPSYKWGLLCSSSWLTQQTTILCFEKQVVSELISSLQFIERIITIFGFEGYWILVASRKKSPKRRQEQEAINWLNQALQEGGLNFPYSDELEEEEGIEGPRLELRLFDSIKREWTVSTVTVVKHLSKISSEVINSGKEDSLIVLTYCIWESLDRLIALLIERYEGSFPMWLAPEQVRILAIGEPNWTYAREVQACMHQRGLRAGLDLRPEQLGARVHEAKREKIPYIVLIGENERKKRGVSVSQAEGQTQSQFVELESFIERIAILS